MANIKKLQLNGEDIIPITHESAVIDDNGISITDKYQTKKDQNLDTDSKTIIGAINELNVNSIHLGNALGAVEYNDNDNPIIERLDDLESSLIRFIENSSNNDSAKEEALKNLLANILREEGIEITEGDTLTDLITKVDNGFDSKNAEIEELENLIEELSSDGLDIISATTLPATGKENQICVITDNPINNYVVTSNPNYNTNEDSITLYNVCDSTSITPVIISSNGVISYNYISQVCQGSTNLASYVYSEEQWIPLTSASHYLLKNGTLVTGSMLDKFGTFNTGYTAGTGLKITIDSSSYYVNILACNKSVDFSSLNFSKIKVTAYTSAAQLTPYLYVVSSNQTGQLCSSLMSDISPYLYDQSSVHASYGATKHTYELDVSGWSSATGYFGIGGTWSGASAGTLYITDIEFE